MIRKMKKEKNTIVANIKDQNKIIQEISHKIK